LGAEGSGGCGRSVAECCGGSGSSEGEVVAGGGGTGAAPGSARDSAQPVVSARELLGGAWAWAHRASALVGRAEAAARTSAGGSTNSFTGFRFCRQFRAQGSGLRVKGIGLRILGLGLRLYVSRLRVGGLKFRL